MIMNVDSVICDKNTELKFKSFSEECIKLCFSENGHMGVKGVLNHNKIQYISKIKRRNNHLQKKSIHEYQEKAVGFKKNIKNHGFLFHYNISTHNILVDNYFSVRRILNRCYTCLIKLAYPWNIIQDKYNQYQYKGEN